MRIFFSIVSRHTSSSQLAVLVGSVRKASPPRGEMVATPTKLEAALQLGLELQKPPTPQEVLAAARVRLDKCSAKLKATIREELEPIAALLASQFSGRAKDMPAELQVGIVGEVCNIALATLGSALEEATARHVALRECCGSGLDGLDFRTLQLSERLTPERMQDLADASAPDHGLQADEVKRVHDMLMDEYAPPPNRGQLLGASTVRNLLHAHEDEKEEGAAPAATAVVGEAAQAVVDQPQADGNAAAPSESLFGSGLPMLDAPTPQLAPLDEAALRTNPRGWTDEEVLNWDVDILALDAVELMQLAACVFRTSGVLDTFEIPYATLGRFLAAVGSRYHANPYHNFAHGCHVLLGSWLLAREQLPAADQVAGGAGESGDGGGASGAAVQRAVEALQPLHILALLVAAFGHDVDHPGVNNAFLTATSSPLAVRYNDVSVLENHHSSTTFSILSDKRCDVLSTLTHAQRKEVRGLMVGAILATDMAHHQEMVREISHAAESHDAGGQGAVPVLFTLRVLTHVADLGNCAIKWPLSRAWAVRVCDEAIAQAKREQALGLPCGKLTPYTEEQLKARQLVFLDGWVKPLMRVATRLYPACRGRLLAVIKCREACKAVTWKSLKHLIKQKTAEGETLKAAALQPRPPPPRNASTTGDMLI